MAIVPGTESLRRGGHVFTISGAKGVGKTTLMASASICAGDSIPSPTLTECTDVVYIQLDKGGVRGAIDAGFNPGVIDLSSCTSWMEFNKALAAELKELLPLCKNGQVKFVGIDLGRCDQLIRLHVNPQKSTEWEGVRGEGLKLYNSLLILGVSLIGLCHLKAAYSAFEDVPQMKTQLGDSVLVGKEARATGGERAQLTADLSTGVAAPWKANANEFVRERKRTKDGFQYFTHTAASRKFEASNRAMSKLNAVEPGSLTFRAILNKAFDGAI